MPRSSPRDFRSILFGRHHAYLAFVAALLALVASVLRIVGRVSYDQFTQGMSVFLMMYFASTVIAIAYGTETAVSPRLNARLTNAYWHYGRYLYGAAVLAAAIHIVFFNLTSSAVLQVWGVAAAVWVLPAIAIWYRARMAEAVADEDGPSA